jgi:hypothetical protein
MTNKNTNLKNAAKAKKDEFYTQLTDIEKECFRYKEYFKGKTIFCNCDDPYESNFFKYFALNFNFFGIKKLIATCYAGSPIANKELSLFDDEDEENKTTKNPHKIEIVEIPDMNQDGAVDLTDVQLLLSSDRNRLTRLKGDGDFRSQECIDILKQADVVITNPPFSLFREYVAQLMEHDKKFLIIGHQNAITYKGIFKFIRDNKLWIGYNNFDNSRFIMPDYYDITKSKYAYEESGVKYGRVSGLRWYTNLDVKKRHEEMILYKKYTPEEYPHYDNYDAIEVTKTIEIPSDWDGVMGVPVTFLDKYNPDQFEIVGSNRDVDQDPNGIYGRGSLLNGKETFKRLFIKRRK